MLLVMPFGLAARADAFVYWANQDAGTIGRADLDGDPASVSQSFVTGASGPSGVAVDGAHVYWGLPLASLTTPNLPRRVVATRKTVAALPHAAIVALRAPLCAPVAADPV